MKKLVTFFLTLAMVLSLAACGGSASGSADASSTAGTAAETNEVVAAAAAQSVDVSALYPDAVTVELSDSGITTDDDSITVTNDIVYYEAGHDFTYGEGTEADEHTAEEAAAHTVVTITRPGTYVLSGSLSAGQIAVDLGDDAEEDPAAVVTLVLNGVDISCTVAPAVIFYNVYECGSKDIDDAAQDVDTSAAGANVVLPDGSVNNVSGSYVARIYKSYELSDDGTEVVDSKKLHKYDAAFYSKMSMNMDGGEQSSGVLNIIAENEGLDSELHLTINGGLINIHSGNDGINTNEDEISVTTINGGTVNIVCSGSTGEGDGIDSNGWLVINGGRVYAQACATSGDAGIDSELGIYLNGGTVMASGNMLDPIAGGRATYMVLQTSQPVNQQTVTLKNADGAAVMAYSNTNAYQYLILSADVLTAGDYTLWADETQLGYGSTAAGMGMGGRGQKGELPEGVGDFDPASMGGRERPEGMEDMQGSGFGGGQRPDGQSGELPDGMKEFDPAAMEKPDGMELPDGAEATGGRGGMNGRFGGMSAAAENGIFTLVTGGNLFSGVGEYTPAEATEE